MSGSQHPKSGSQQVPSNDVLLGTPIDQILDRIKVILHVEKTVDMAKKLGTTEDSVFSAKSRKKIPDWWLVKLSREYQADLNWVLTGVGTPPGVVEDQDVPCDISCFGPQFVELAELIELVETRMQAAKRNLPPKRKAKAIVAAYKLWMQDKDLAIEALESFFPAIEED